MSTRISKPKILFAAQDVGGFNAILPVIKRLHKSRKLKTDCWLGGIAAKMAANEKIIFKNCTYLNESHLRKFFTNISPDLLCVGTSFGDSLDKKLMRIAKSEKVPSLAIIDFWSNYKERFDSLTDGLPNKICVMDNLAKKQMIAAGFPKERLAVTGNPFFETFATGKNDLGIKIRGQFIVFFEQPFSELFAQNTAPFFGFDEIKVWGHLTEVLSRLKIKEPIKIKFHPRTQKKHKFNEINEKGKLNVEIVKKLSAEELIKDAKLVIGMNSAILFQAALTGKKVLSYQPNLKRPDPLISNKLGLSLGIYRKSELEGALKRLLEKEVSLKSKKKVDYYVNSDATGKVLKVIGNMLQK